MFKNIVILVLSVLFVFSFYFAINCTFCHCKRVTCPSVQSEGIFYKKEVA